MAETTNLNLRIDKALKEDAEHLFSELGMSMTTAFTIFVRQSIREGKIPFEISLRKPNAETLEAMQEVAGMKKGLIAKAPQSVASFFAEIDE